MPDHGRVPKYYAVKARLIALLGELGEGAALPAERDLAVEYGVSRATLRHAIAELVLEGRLRAMRDTRHDRGHRPARASSRHRPVTCLTAPCAFDGGGSSRG